jgi:hypothetical protein
VLRLSRPAFLTHRTTAGGRRARPLATAGCSRPSPARLPLPELGEHDRRGDRPRLDLSSCCRRNFSQETSSPRVEPHICRQSTSRDIPSALEASPAKTRKSRRWRVVQIAVSIVLRRLDLSPSRSRSSPALPPSGSRSRTPPGDGIPNSRHRCACVAVSSQEAAGAAVTTRSRSGQTAGDCCFSAEGTVLEGSVRPAFCIWAVQ